MLCTTAINTSNTIRTQTGAADIVIIIILYYYIYYYYYFFYTPGSIDPRG